MSYQPETGAGSLFTSGQEISLSFPADPGYFLLARMSTSALASQLSFGIDDVEELRLAIDELLGSCATGATEDARIDLTFTLNDGEITIVCIVSPIQEMTAQEANDLGQLSQQLLAERILDALTDAHGSECIAPNARRGWIRRAKTADRS